jgi:hypothetical protein
MNFKAWEGADRVVIREESKTTVKTITDRSAISQIAAFAEARSTGWGTPLAGTPVANITLDFFADGRFLGHLGIGKTFIESQGCGAFVSRALTNTDRGQIVRLIGVPEAAIAE